MRSKKEIAYLFRCLREGMGLSKSDLCALVGLPVRFYDELPHEWENLTLAQVQKVASFFKINPNWITGKSEILFLPEREKPIKVSSVRDLFVLFLAMGACRYLYVPFDKNGRDIPFLFVLQKDNTGVVLDLSMLTSSGPYKLTKILSDVLLGIADSVNHEIDFVFGDVLFLDEIFTETPEWRDFREAHLLFTSSNS